MTPELAAERATRRATAASHQRSVKNRPIEFPKWFSIAQAAEYLGVGPMSVRRLGYSGEIPMFRIGREFKVRQVDVEAYIERQRVIPTSERLAQ